MRGFLRNVREWSEYINSPANEIRDGAAKVRENLKHGPSQARKQAGKNDMQSEGPDQLCGVAAVP